MFHLALRFLGVNLHYSVPGRNCRMVNIVVAVRRVMRSVTSSGGDFIVLGSCVAPHTAIGVQ